MRIESSKGRVGRESGSVILTDCSTKACLRKLHPSSDLNKVRKQSCRGLELSFSRRLSFVCLRSKQEGKFGQSRKEKAMEEDQIGMI